MDKTSAATLEEVLRFCYTGTATLTAATVLHICTVADQFQIHALHQQCKQYIEVKRSFTALHTQSGGVSGACQDELRNTGAGTHPLRVLCGPWRL